MTSLESAAAPVPVDLAAEVAAAAQLACLLEVSAPKPGNVSPGRHFGDMRYEDFLASAAAIGGPLAGVGGRPLGATVRLAIEATARWAGANTNLGIVLLLAPVARAAVESRSRRPVPPAPLRVAVGRVLDATTVEDAREVYAAIRRASPGGLGHADEQDVAGDPDVTLLEAMRLAAHRDGIAREYATTFDTTFNIGLPALTKARADGLTWDEAIVETFLVLLAAAPDTHIARRAGTAAASEVHERAQRVLAAGGVRTPQGQRAVAVLDEALRDGRNLRNPGTTADLTAAVILVELLTGSKLNVESAK
jgi:triphosphoribosyl-dephospho-CoA synthase